MDKLFKQSIASFYMPQTDVEKVKLYWDFRKTQLNSGWVWVLTASLTIAVLLNSLAQTSLYLWVFPWTIFSFWLVLTVLQRIQRGFTELAKEIDMMLGAVEKGNSVESLEKLVGKSMSNKLGRFKGVGLSALVLLLLRAIFLSQYSPSALNVTDLGFALSVLGLVFSLSGSVLLIIPRLRRKEWIEALSGTYWGENPHLKKALTTDTQYAIVGLSLLIVGFALQLVGRVLP